MSSRGVVIEGGHTLRPPGREGDCTCFRCCVYRNRHALLRAVVLTLTVPLPLLLANSVADANPTSEGAILGGLYITTTLWAFLVLTTWVAPIRRAIHRFRPRTTEWPPPPDV